MKNEWIQFKGWGIMLRLYILPFWFVIIFLFSLFIVKMILGVYKFPKAAYSLFKVSLSVSVISFCLFMLESILTHVFAVLMRFNDPEYGFMAVSDSFGLSVYENVGFFVFTFLTVCVCVYLSYIFNSRFTTRILPAIEKSKGRAVLFISIFTSPLIFFVPMKQLLINLFPVKW